PPAGREKKSQAPGAPACLRDHSRVVRRDLALGEGRGTLCLRAAKRGVREEQRRGGDTRRLPDGGLGRMRNVHHHPESIAGSNDVGAKWREAMVDNGTRLEVADVVGG